MTSPHRNRGNDDQRPRRRSRAHNVPARGGQPRGAQRARTPARISAARLVAYDVLRDVTERDAYANLALAARIRAARLDRRDAALATELAAGTLRGLIRYDRIIELASGRPLAQIDARTLNVLRLGAHQLLSMRTAPHAAVHESVELQRKVANASAAGFVNGVLRAVSRVDSSEWDRRIVDTAQSPDDALAARTSHPAWVIRAFRDALRSEGREHELESLLDSDNASPRVNLVQLPGYSPDLIAEEFAKSGVGKGEKSSGIGSGGELGEDLGEDTLAAKEPAVRAVGPSPIGLQLRGGGPAELMAQTGRPVESLRVQDQGSQLAALALTRARPVRGGERWLDLCAGPGGKTAVLAAEARLAGATVRANEVSEHRAELVRESVKAVDDVVEVVSHDGRDDSAFGTGEAPFDRILVDAPCSGLGALRRRPEARHRKQPGDLPELTRLQSELLTAAAAHLAPGGLLAYVTCSPHLAETRTVVDRFLRAHADFRERDARAVITAVARGEIDVAGDRSSVQLWPHRHDTDAMFIALIERAETGSGEGSNRVG